VLPVAKKSGIDVTVVAGDLAKAQEHSTNAGGTEKQKNCDGASQACGGLGVIENAD
jgi:hypothetical protein